MNAFPVLNGLLKFQRLVMVICSAFIVTAVAAIAFQRYVFGGNLYGIEEFMSFAAFWMYFMGATYATHLRSHISAEVFSIYCTHSPTRTAVALLRTLITFGLCILYTVWGWDFFYWSLTSGGKSSVWQMPLAIGHGAVFFGFVLMSWYFLVELLTDLSRVFGWNSKLIMYLNPPLSGDHSLEERTLVEMGLEEKQK